MISKQSRYVSNHRYVVFLRVTVISAIFICLLISIGLFSPVQAQDVKYRVNESVLVDENQNPSTIILRKQEIKRDIVIREVSSIINREMPQHVIKQETKTVYNVAERSIVQHIPQHVIVTRQTTVVVETPLEKDPHILVFDVGTAAGNKRYDSQLKCFKAKKEEFWPTTLVSANKSSQNSAEAPMDSRQIWLFRTAQPPYFENKWPISETAYPFESYFRQDPEDIKTEIQTAFEGQLLNQLQTWKNVEIWLFTDDINVKAFFNSALQIPNGSRIRRVHLLNSDNCDFDERSKS